MAQDFAKRSKSRPKKTPPRRFSLGSYLAGVVSGGALFLLGAYAPDVLRNNQADARSAAAGYLSAADRPSGSAPAGGAQGSTTAPSTSANSNTAQTTHTTKGKDAVTSALSNGAAAGTPTANTITTHSNGRADGAPGVPSTGSMTAAQPAESSPGAIDAGGEQTLAMVQNELQFEFHNVLDDNQVEPDLTAYEQDVRAQQARQPAATPDMHYLLQSGSFQIMSDAEMRRGSLLLLDLPATIVEARIDSKIWYRVIVGPYTARGDAQQAVTLMRANEIASIWLEQPQAEG